MNMTLGSPELTSENRFGKIVEDFVEKCSSEKPVNLFGSLGEDDLDFLLEDQDRFTMLQDIENITKNYKKVPQICSKDQYQDWLDTVKENARNPRATEIQLLSKSLMFPGSANYEEQKAKFKNFLETAKPEDVQVLKKLVELRPPFAEAGAGQEFTENGFFSFHAEAYPEQHGEKMQLIDEHFNQDKKDFDLLHARMESSLFTKDEFLKRKDVILSQGKDSSLTAALEASDNELSYALKLPKEYEPAVHAAKERAYQRHGNFSRD